MEFTGAGLRAALGELFSRASLAKAAGLTFGGNRDMYDVLGYPRQITSQMYRDMYDRGGIAGRIIDAKPDDTWSEGLELLENEDPEQTTPFEQAFLDLDARLNIWSVLHKADKLSGIGRCAVIVLGAPGQLQEPLTSCTPENLVYLSVFAEPDIKIETEDLERDTSNVRFGLPNFYGIKRMLSDDKELRRVHYTRVIHIADDRLDDRLFGKPRLERVWNLLECLEKVTGGGSEAFWLNCRKGMQIDLDKDVAKEIAVAQASRGKPSNAMDEAMQEEIEKYANGLTRIMRTIGTKVTEFGADIIDFTGPASAVIAQIAASSTIPQRILMGSERGELASTQDDDNWQGRMAARRAQYAGPFIVKPFIDRLIELKTLPEVEEYLARWPEVNNLTELERAQYANVLSKLNAQMGMVVVTPDEIRDKALQWPKLEDVDHDDVQPPGQVVEDDEGRRSTDELRAAAAKFARKIKPATVVKLSRRTSSSRQASTASLSNPDAGVRQSA